MDLSHVGFAAPLRDYQEQAARLLAAWERGDRDAIEIFRHCHPRFLSDEVVWLPRNLSEAEIRSVRLDAGDARLAIARWYDFADWSRLAQYVADVADSDSPVHRFEAAADAVVTGDVSRLSAQLHDNPGLVDARSTRVTHFDPPIHRATLLHYVAANGVENHRQKTPPNIVEVARLLLAAGADPDALADTYGGRHTTMSMLVSSHPPAAAKLQVPLVDLLVDFGASVEGRGEGKWTTPLKVALAFGYQEAADALVRRGAKVADLPDAAGLGRLEQSAQLLPASSLDERHRALVLAAQLGHAEIVRLLLDAGEDPNRYNPDGLHGHSTPLHQAALAGHDGVVRLLVERGASPELEDKIYGATPQGWAEHGGQRRIAEYLRGRRTPG
jgi:ankyrin repeat protein